MKPYQIDEGTFVLPDDRAGQDRSLNIFRHSADSTVLMVSRGAIPEKFTFEEELENQWAQLLAVVDMQHCEPGTRVQLPRSPGFDARQTDCHFRRGANTQYQRQLAIHLPASRQMLIFTHTSLHPFTAANNQYWQQLRETVCLMRPSEAAAHG